MLKSFSPILGIFSHLNTTSSKKLTLSHHRGQSVDSVKFSGKTLNELCSRPTYNHNPFEDRKDQIERSSAYQDVATRWEKNAQGGFLTKTLRIGAIGAGHVIGNVIEAHGGIGASNFAGELAGAAIGEYVTEPVVKLFTKPDMIKQKEYAASAAERIRTNVYDSCGKIKNNINNGYWFWFGKNYDLAAMLEGLVSRYGKEQNDVKSLLPNIKGKSRTRENIIPLLQADRRADLKESRRVSGSSGASYSIQELNVDDSNCIGTALDHIRDKFGDEIATGILPDSFRTDVAPLYRRKYREIKEKLPDLIDYLQD